MILVGSACEWSPDHPLSVSPLPALVQAPILTHLLGILNSTQLFLLSCHLHCCLGRLRLVSLPSHLPPSEVLSAGSTLESPGALVTKPGTWAPPPRSRMELAPSCWEILTWSPGEDPALLQRDRSNTERIPAFTPSRGAPFLPPRARVLAGCSLMAHNCPAPPHLARGEPSARNALHSSSSSPLGEAPLIPTGKVPSFVPASHV